VPIVSRREGKSRKEWVLAHEADTSATSPIRRDMPHGTFQNTIPHRLRIDLPPAGG
jgi:hypothetical protein